MVGFAGESQSFDGNGSYTRTATGGGDILIKTRQARRPPEEPRSVLYGQRARAAAGHAARSARRSTPPYKTNVACYKNPKPNLNGPAAEPGPPDQACVRRRREARDPEAHARLHRDHRAVVLVALGVAGYILSHQRFYLPNWVPVLGTDFFELKGEFSTAQSVTPGQGQTVDIAGVPVGEIKKVELKNGRALVTMEIKQKYANLIKSDATMLLRPEDRPQGHDRRAGPGHARHAER